MIKIGDVKLGATTGPAGNPQVRLAIDLEEHEADAMEAARRLDREEVLELRDALDAWLAGEVLR